MSDIEPKNNPKHLDNRNNFRAGSNSSKSLATRVLGAQCPRILMLKDHDVNSQWEKLVSEMQYDITQKLKGLVLIPDYWREFDIDIIDLAGSQLAKNCIENGVTPRNVVFLVHDKELFTHVGAYIDEFGDCFILAVWPCNEDGDKGEASNRRPSALLSQIRSSYLDLIR